MIISMSEIVVHFDEIAPILDQLKQQALQLEAVLSMPKFANTKLNLTEGILAIEEKYQNTLKIYQTVLFKVTEEIEMSLQNFAQTEQHVARQNRWK